MQGDQTDTARMEKTSQKHCLGRTQRTSRGSQVMTQEEGSPAVGKGVLGSSSSQRTQGYAGNPHRTFTYKQGWDDSPLQTLLQMGSIYQPASAGTLRPSQDAPGKSTPGWRQVKTRGLWKQNLETT